MERRVDVKGLEAQLFVLIATQACLGSKTHILRRSFSKHFTYCRWIRLGPTKNNFSSLTLGLAKFSKVRVMVFGLLMLFNGEHICNIVLVNLMHCLPTPCLLVEITPTLILFIRLLRFILVSFRIISLLTLIWNQLAGFMTIPKHCGRIILHIGIFWLHSDIVMWIPYGWRMYTFFLSTFIGRWFDYPIVTRLRFTDNSHYILDRRFKSTAITLVDILTRKGLRNCGIHLVFDSHTLVFLSGV